jgi:Ca2+-binding RTX toxin-like protein
MLDLSPPTKEAEMLSHPLPKRFTDVASLAIGVNLAVQAVLAGAPFDESLLGGLIAGVGVFLVYTVARTGSLPGASVSARQALRRPATRRVAGATAAAAGVLLLVVGFAPDAEARTRCSYAGPPANTLTVTVSGEGIGVIGRQGPEITAGEFLAGPGACSGGTPTVLNTDTISVLLGPEAFADLELAGGPFAPGATVETEGASEIEVQFSGAGSLANIVGTSRGDEFHWGNGGAHAGLNLNPRTALDKDVDVTTRGNLAFLVADGAGGRDTIIGEPGALVRDGVFAEGGRGNDVLKAPSSTGGILEGGPGNDAITGSRFSDELAGAAGNDRVAGAGGPDNINGGSGEDRLSGGAGRDYIKSRDSKRDTVRCGSGRDRVRADSRDRLRGCERISRR